MSDRRAVRPKDAATLILVRTHGGGPQILMGQRHGAHKFMPHKFVFPGGRVDPGDGRIQPASELQPDTEARLRRFSRGASPRALAMAAVRETYEETGLRVGVRPGTVPRTRSPAWAKVLATGVVPDLAALRFIARAITPPSEGMRFDTRFFLADAALIQGDVDLDLKGSGELLDLSWLALDEAKALDLPGITRMVLGYVEQHLAANLRGEEPRVPFLRFRSGRPRQEWL